MKEIDDFYVPPNPTISNTIKQPNPVATPHTGMSKTLTIRPPETPFDERPQPRAPAPPPPQSYPQPRPPPPEPSQSILKPRPPSPEPRAPPAPEHKTQNTSQPKPPLATNSNLVPQKFQPRPPPKKDTPSPQQHPLQPSFTSFGFTQFGKS